jgi:hypothetical protein
MEDLMERTRLLAKLGTLVVVGGAAAGCGNVDPSSAEPLGQAEQPWGTTAAGPVQCDDHGTMLNFEYLIANNYAYYMGVGMPFHGAYLTEGSYETDHSTDYPDMFQYLYGARADSQNHHGLRDASFFTLPGPGWQTALTACGRTGRDYIRATDLAVYNWGEQYWLNHMLGTAVHTLQDSFNPRHANREGYAPLDVLEDMCFPPNHVLPTPGFYYTLGACQHPDSGINDWPSGECSDPSNYPHAYQKAFDVGLWTLNAAVDYARGNAGAFENVLNNFLQCRNVGNQWVAVTGGVPKYTIRDYHDLAYSDQESLDQTIGAKTVLDADVEWASKGIPHIVVAGSDRQLYHSSKHTGDWGIWDAWTWPGWGHVPTVSDVQSVGAAMVKNDLLVFTIDNHGKMYYRARREDAWNWSSEINMNTLTGFTGTFKYVSPFVGRPGALDYPDAPVGICGVGNDWKLYYTAAYYDGYNLTNVVPFKQMATGGWVVDAACAQVQSGVYALVTDSQGNLTFGKLGGTFTTLDRPDYVKRVAIAPRGPLGELQLAAVGRNGRVYAKGRTPEGAWSAGWEDVTAANGWPATATTVSVQQ